ncbi:hypothetical protein ACVWW6_005566 [Bradyrhizobium sp. USDA 3311]
MSLFAEQLERQRRLALRRRFPWLPLPGFEPSFEVLREQYSAEFRSAFNGWPCCEWSPAEQHDAHVHNWRIARMLAFQWAVDVVRTISPIA